MTLALLAILLLTPTIGEQQPDTTLDATLYRGRFFAPVYLNGRGPFQFLVDMGASGAGRIDRRLLDSLGIAISGRTSNDDGVTTRSVPVARLTTLRSGAVTMANADLLVGDYVRTDSGRTLAVGIVGADFFRDHTVEFDFPAGTIRLSSRPLRSGDAGVRRYEEPFRIHLQLGADSIPANLDTGSNLSVHLPLQLSARLGIDSLRRGPRARRQFTEVQLFEGRPRVSLSLAGLALPDDDVYFSEIMVDRANIGGGVLRHFRVAYDQRNRLVRLAPPSRRP